LPRAGIPTANENRPRNTSMLVCVCVDPALASLNEATTTTAGKGFIASGADDPRENAFCNPRVAAAASMPSDSVVRTVTAQWYANIGRWAYTPNIDCYLRVVIAPLPTNVGATINTGIETRVIDNNSVIFQATCTNANAQNSVVTIPCAATQYLSIALQPTEQARVVNITQIPCAGAL
jgi:hypothetical protein